MKQLTLAALLLLTVGAAMGRSESPANKEDGVLLVANKGDRALSLIDPIAKREIARVDEKDTTGHEVVASPDGKLAYVPIYGDSGVGKPGSDGTHMLVIDLTTHKIVSDVDFGKGVRPHCVLIGPKDGMIYVSTELDNTISIVDPKTLKVIGTVPTGQAESHMVALTRDGKRAYTANVGPGTVSAIDLAARKTTAVIPVSRVTQRISLSVDDKWVFTSDQTQPRLAVIDTVTNTVARWVTLPGIGYGTAPTADGRWLIVCMPKVNKVAVIDLKTFEVARTIDVPATPQEVIVRPDDKIAYVSCDASAKVAAIRTSDWQVDALIDAGKGADGLAWAAAAPTAGSR